ncbi:extracellular solute-binding protein [Actinoallomurus sp. NPDC052274]|uniref:ABC transporter substrate-binding protein n=1 Tax=Actinoallomurus sp. NPDC052274 TaxID=3155420 RepID=UPI003449E559
MGTGLRTSRKRVVHAVAAATALLAATTGCAGGSGGSGGGKTLTMWTFKQTHVKALEAAAASFTAKTGITVKITAYTPDDTYTSKVQSAAAAHNLADVLELHAAGEDRVFGASGILTDLASSVDAGWKGQYLQGTADAGLVTDSVYQASQKPKSPWKGIKKGQMFDVPFTAGTFGIVFANKSKLQAAGIDPTKPPKTWEELISWIKATHDKDPAAGGIAMGLKVTSTAFDWALQPLTYAYLGKPAYQALFGQDRSQAWGSPNGQRALTVYDKITPYWTAGSQTLGIDDADQAFAQGKSAFDIGGTFTMASIKQDGMDPGDIVAFGLPAAQGSAVQDFKLAPIALTGLGISAQSKNQKAALQWVRYLSDKEQAGAFAQASLDLPATDLGADASRLVGKDLSSLEAVFGTGDNAYDASNSTFSSSSWDIEKAGDLLVKMSPLKELSPAALNTRLGAYAASTWK